MKKTLDRIFIDGLSGMAQGLFATLIIGTIIQQIGAMVTGNTGAWIVLIGKVASSNDRRRNWCWSRKKI